jgi:hypothetical protein
VPIEPVLPRTTTRRWSLIRSFSRADPVVPQ